MTGWVGGLSTTLSGDLVSLESSTRWMKLHSCSRQPSNIKLLKSVFLPLLLLCQENVGLHNTNTAYALIMNISQIICPSTQVKCKNLRRAPFKAQNSPSHPICTTTIIYDSRVLVWPQSRRAICLERHEQRWCNFFWGFVKFQELLRKITLSV